MDPNCGAENDERALWNDPIGVLAAETITTSCKLRVTVLENIFSEKKNFFQNSISKGEFRLHAKGVKTRPLLQYYCTELQ